MSHYLMDRDDSYGARVMLYPTSPSGSCPFRVATSAESQRYGAWSEWENVIFSIA